MTQIEADGASHFAEMPDPEGYLARMKAPLREKLKIGQFIPAHAKTVVDVGCADGTVTLALAEMMPNVHFLGIDLDADFIELARQEASKRGIKNVTFECVYLRELLARPERYDVVLFCSVWHEFFSYGEGISTIVKALADAHELLNPRGRIAGRDMILSKYTATSDLRVAAMRAKIEAKANPQLLRDFVEQYGPLDNVANVNHFLLKYMYDDNWERELFENYIGVWLEEYEQIFKLLGMQLEYVRSYTLAFLENKWASDFGLTEDEITQFKSTTILVAEKPQGQPKRSKVRARNGD